MQRDMGASQDCGCNGQMQKGEKLRSSVAPLGVQVAPLYTLGKDYVPDQVVGYSVGTELRLIRSLRF